MTDTSLSVGTVIAGKYRVQRVLGEGGMGVVVAAEHIDLGQRVALKFLQPSVAARADVVERFLREAKAGVRIACENVVRVLDVGKLENGSPYMVMEFMEGTDLEAEISAKGRLSITETVDLMLQACLGVAEAHRAGVIHRDLKPANLFLCTRNDGSQLLKVLDFGISKVLSTTGTDAGLTKTSMTMGSVHFMSPEQIRATKHVDARTDIWALGVIMYQALSGELPFDGPTQSAVMAQVLEATPKPLHERVVGIPPRLEAAVNGCMEKDHDKRFSSVAQIASALGPLASPSARDLVERISRVLGFENVPRSGVSAPPASKVKTATAFGRTNPSAGGRPAWPLAAGAVALLLIGGGAAFLLTRSETPEAATAAPMEPPTAFVARPTPAPPPAPAAPAATAPIAPPNPGPEGTQLSALPLAEAEPPAAGPKGALPAKSPVPAHTAVPPKATQSPPPTKASVVPATPTKPAARKRPSLLNQRF